MLSIVKRSVSRGSGVEGLLSPQGLGYLRGHGLGFLRGQGPANAPLLAGPYLTPQEEPCPEKRTSGLEE